MRWRGSCCHFAFLSCVKCAVGYARENSLAIYSLKKNELTFLGPGLVSFAVSFPHSIICMQDKMEMGPSPIEVRQESGGEARHAGFLHL